MRYLKLRSLELGCELVLYIILSSIYYFATRNKGLSLDDMYVVLALWLAMVAYRLLYLQLPISWIFIHYLPVENRIRAELLKGGVNFSTFIVVIALASLFSPVVAGFLEPERIFIPVIALISTTFSPLIFGFFEYFVEKVSAWPFEK